MECYGKARKYKSSCTFESYEYKTMREFCQYSIEQMR